MKVLALRQHSPHAALLGELLGSEFDVQGIVNVTPEALNADVLVTTHLSSEEASATTARLVHVPGAGYEGIAWRSLPDGCVGANVFCHEVPIAEYVLHAALAHVFAQHKPLPLTETTWPRAYLQREFRDELYGRRMTIVGTGHIGQEVAKRAQAFGIATTGINRRGGAAPYFNVTAPIGRIDAFLADADILVLCCPLDDTTRHLFDRERLARLPSTCLFINVARGEVVEEEALYEALRDRRIGAAVLDVWYQYPKTVDDALAPSRFPFVGLSNVATTPHISGWSRGLLDRRYRAIADNIRRLKEGLTLENTIWPDR
ncbi:D-isomer specific 2-hydroxyacid dehydrogenase NAD-binding subunit [Caballeronia hypogeia]|uniref:D-isomer specific 2-hydroxyacid dehydrogenase NAD-binding subunit n=1 Tax=Caballeronia hypogeia TaxID=1777140 RepID=A0A158BTX8_9BURK|nr:2-hydroxyacid dehydrogenase [Caballeronia hypogeia]SAK72717.1 D-isomer specific 2-hydroxyacid dehydrogenase NAD-binding subunit [Caballeronia hypogeia]